MTWTGKLICSVELTFSGIPFVTGQDYIHYESDISCPAEYKITGVYITCNKTIPYSPPEKEKINDTTWHIKINPSIPQDSIVTVRVNTEKVVFKEGYTIVTEFPSFLSINPPAGEYKENYHGILSCNNEEYIINSATLTRNDNECTGITFIDNVFHVDIESWNNEDVFKIIATANKAYKTFTFLINSKAGYEITPEPSESMQEYHGIFKAMEGYKIKSFQFEKNYIPIDTNYISNEDGSYTISIGNDDFVDGDVFRISANVEKTIDYTIEQNFNVPIIFSPAIENPLHERYVGYINAPENYHFMYAGFKAELDNTAGTLQKMNDKQYLFSTSVRVQNGENFVISGRLEKDIDENNIDKYPFIHIYNPTNKDLDELAKQGCPPLTTYEDGQTTLSSYIIRMMKVFCEVPSSRKEGILLASYDSQIQSNVVDNPDIELFCGEIKIEEYFQNIADYDLTFIQFYVPFIGLVDVDTDLVMNELVGLKYNISLVTGEFIATIYIVKDMEHKEVKMMNGNMAVEIPFSVDYRKTIKEIITDKGFSLIDLTPSIDIRYHEPLGLNSKYAHETKKIVNLGELEGFTVVSNIELNLVGYERMMYDEEIMILELLKEGVIL